MKTVKVKKVGSLNPKLLAVFVAGLAVATLAWWYSDRLDLAFGADAGINMIAFDKTGASTPARECGPGERPQISRQFDGCNVVTTTASCTPIKSYLSYRKTRTGYSAAISERMSKRAVEQIAYKKQQTEERRTMMEERQKINDEIAQLKRERPQLELQRDQNYLEKLSAQREIDLAARRNPRCITGR